MSDRLGAVTRTARPSDLDECTRLALQADAEGRADAWLEALSDDLDHPDRLLVVAETADEVVGYGRARLFAPEIDAPADTAPEGHYLMGLFVRPDSRRLGIGSALVEARLRWIRRRTHEAWYFVNARNEASIELHNRFGFVEVTRAFSFPKVTFGGGEGILFRARLDS
jgi:ribosomal protein S18 acetylase RimI-like enzyme